MFHNYHNPLPTDKFFVKHFVDLIFQMPIFSISYENQNINSMIWIDTPCDFQIFEWSEVINFSPGENISNKHDQEKKR